MGGLRDKKRFSPSRPYTQFKEVKTSVVRPLTSYLTNVMPKQFFSKKKRSSIQGNDCWVSECIRQSRMLNTRLKLHYKENMSNKTLCVGFLYWLMRYLFVISGREYLRAMRLKSTLLGPEKTWIDRTQSELNKYTN